VRPERIDVKMDIRETVCEDVELNACRSYGQESYRFEMVYTYRNVTKRFRSRYF